MQDAADKWLRDNDPEYGQAYMTSERIKKIQRKEIPFSAFKDWYLDAHAYRKI